MSIDGIPSQSAGRKALPHMPQAGRGCQGDGQVPQRAGGAMSPSEDAFHQTLWIGQGTLYFWFTGKLRQHNSPLIIDHRGFTGLKEMFL